MWITSPGAIDRLEDAIDRNLVSYLCRYTGMSLSDIDRSRLTRLMRIADGVSEIISEENKPSKKD